MPDTLIELLGRIDYATDTEDRGDDAADAVQYRTLLAPEGLMTSDHRYIEDGALSWREGQPVHVMWSDSETDAHGDASLVGTFVGIHKEIIDGVTWVVADDIDWDLHEDNDTSARAKRLVDEGRLPGVSVHMAEMDADYDCPDDENEPCTLTVHSGVIAAATIVAIPAFEESVIEPVAAAGVDLYAPPRSWFDNPELTEPTPLTVTDEGRIFGHLALWDSCHIGFDNMCVTPPRDATDYAEFHAHAQVRTAEGAVLPVGVITVDGSHAALDLSAEQTIRHYDSTATVGGYVRAGDDEHGPWVAGALAPGLPAATVSKLERLPLSGDWRPRGDRHILVAALAVPVPGFAIKAHVASGEQTALLTVGLTPEADTESDLALVAAAMSLVADRLSAIEDKLSADERADQLQQALAMFDE